MIRNDWMAVDPVDRELLSFFKFPANRENAGNFRRLPSRAGVEIPRESLLKEPLSLKSARSRASQNREFIGAEQGITTR
jgi:hypothetical protein